MSHCEISHHFIVSLSPFYKLGGWKEEEGRKKNIKKAAGLEQITHAYLFRPTPWAFPQTRIGAKSLCCMEKKNPNMI